MSISRAVRLLLSVFSLLILCGCAAQMQQINEETSMDPPVPTFATKEDCEMAYGLGSCGNGEVIYEQANQPPPPDATEWYMPFAFGAMTGVLVNQYYAAPTVYVSQVRYRRYLSNPERYRALTPATAAHFRSAPVAVQHNAVVHGQPVRYAPAAKSGVSPVTRPATKVKK